MESFHLGSREICNDHLTMMAFDWYPGDMRKIAVEFIKEKIIKKNDIEYEDNDNDYEVRDIIECYSIILHYDEANKLDRIILEINIDDEATAKEAVKKCIEFLGAELDANQLYENAINVKYQSCLSSCDRPEYEGKIIQIIKISEMHFDMNEDLKDMETAKEFIHHLE